MWPFSRKNKKNNTVVIDIGGDSVNLAYIELSKGVRPKIKVSMLQDLGSTLDIEGKRYLELVKKEISNAIDKIQSLNLPTPSKIVCSLPSLLHTSQIRVISMKKKKKFPVKEDIIKDLVDKETKKNNNTLDIIEKKIISIKLNGYEVLNLDGKEAKTLDIWIYITSTTKDILDSIKNTVANRFHNDENIVFHTSSFIIFDAIRTVFPKEKDFIVIDVMKDITEVLVTQDGQLVDFFSYPFGRNSLVKEISNIKNIEVLHAHDTVKSYNEKASKEEEKEYKRLSSTEKEWLSLFDKVINKISIDGHFPKKVFIVNDGLTSSIFKRWLEDRKKELIKDGVKDELIGIYKDFSIEILSSGLLEHLCDIENGVQDINLHILAQTIFVNKM